MGPNSLIPFALIVRGKMILTDVLDNVVIISYGSSIYYVILHVLLSLKMDYMDYTKI